MGSRIWVGGDLDSKRLEPLQEGLVKVPVPIDTNGAVKEKLFE